MSKALLACSFDGTVPHFTDAAKHQQIAQQELTVFYDFQCPYVLQTVEKLQQYCKRQEIPAAFHLVDTLEKAKALPGVFNNWAVFYQGKFQTVNLLDVSALQRILKRA